MDPASVQQWPRMPKRKAAFNHAQKTWLNQQFPEFQKSKEEGSAVMVLAQELAEKMTETWPVEISEEDRAQAATEEIAKVWALRSRGSSIYWYYTNKQRGKKMGKTNSGALNLHGRKPRKKSQPQCFATLYYKELDLEAAAVAERLKFIRDNPIIAKKWRVASTVPTTSSSNIAVLKGLGDDDDDDEEEEEEEEEVVATKKKKETDPTAMVRFRQIAIKRAWAEATEEQKRRTLLNWSKQDDDVGSEESDNDSEGDKVSTPAAAGPSGGASKTKAKLKAKQEAERSKCITQIEQSFRNALHSLYTQTGWKGFVCLGGLGGPNAKPGQLSCVKVSSKMSRVKPFEDSYANFDNAISIPFGRWLQAEFTAEIDEAKGLLPEKADVSFNGLIPLEKQESPPPGSSPSPPDTFSSQPSTNPLSPTLTGLELPAHEQPQPSRSAYSSSTFSSLNTHSPPTTPLMTPAMLEPAELSPVPGFHPRSRVAPSRPPLVHDLTQSPNMSGAAVLIAANSEPTSTVPALASAGNDPEAMVIDCVSTSAPATTLPVAPSAAGLNPHLLVPPSAPLGVAPEPAVLGPAVASVSACAQHDIHSAAGTALLAGPSSPRASLDTNTTPTVASVASVSVIAHSDTLTPASTPNTAPVPTSNQFAVSQAPIIASASAVPSATTTNSDSTVSPAVPLSAKAPTLTEPSPLALILSSPGVQQSPQATVVYASERPVPLLSASTPPEESHDPGQLITEIKNVFANVDDVYSDITCLPTSVKVKAHTWIALANTLARFEHSFQVPGTLCTKAAPKSVHSWIAAPDSNISVSAIQHITHMRKWWISLQPTWRHFQSPAPSDRAVRSWDSLFSTGVHGISMVARAIWWWEKKHSKTADSMDAVAEDVMALLADITAVLGIMLDDNAAGFSPSGYNDRTSTFSVAPAASSLPASEDARKRLRSRTETESRKRQKTADSANTPEAAIRKAASVKKAAAPVKGAGTKSKSKYNTRRK